MKLYISKIFIFLFLIFTTTFVVFADDSSINQKNFVNYNTLPISVTQEVYNNYTISATSNNILLKSKSSDIQTLINVEKFDDSFLAKSKSLFDTSSDWLVFNKLVSYKESYLYSLEEEYKKDLMYSESDNELIMKIFKTYKENIFEQESSIIIYNILESSKVSSNENIYIEFIVPSLLEKTIFNIKFSIPKGNLDSDHLNEIINLISDIKLGVLPELKTIPTIFNDINVINDSNTGIYKDIDNRELKYSNISNEKLGYQLYYPSNFIPYKSNTIYEETEYISFKIDYYNTFNFSVEPSDIHTLDKKESEIIENKDYIIKSNDRYDNMIFIRYFDKNTNTSIQECFIIHNSQLYSFELRSKYIETPLVLQNQFKKIICSVKFLDKQDNPNNFLEASDLSNKYNISLPDNWQIIESQASNSNYKLYSIKDKDLSDSFKIILREYPSKSENISYPFDYIKIDKLLEGSYQIADMTYSYQLINYLDINNRTNFCYIVEIESNDTTYSLFISVPDYAIKDGHLDDENLNKILQDILGSFKKLN